MEQISRFGASLSPISVVNIALVLRALNDASEPVSHEDLVSLSRIKREDAWSALDCLESRAIVSRVSPRDDTYLFDRTKEFLMLSFNKRVSVSPEGHRSVRVAGSLLSVRDGSQGRIVGSTVWKSEMSAPRVRLGPASRKSLVPGLKNGSCGFEKVPSPNNDAKFQLNFDPPLSAGELIDYGFYVWNGNHYARTRSEAVEKFKDEWIREGLVVRDPTLKLGIEVNLPGNYRHQRARAARNVVFSGDGTAVSQGETLGVGALSESPEKLELSVDNPELGNYFLCWVPPE